MTIGVIVVTWIAYAGALHNGVVWDDAFLTTRNPYLASVRGLLFSLSHDSWTASGLGEHGQVYRPLPLLSYSVDRAVFGNAASAYHLGNLVVHALCAVGVGVWVAQRSRGRLLGLAAALLFATLPLASEPGFYIAGRFDSLGLLFVLAALCAAQLRGRLATTLVVLCVVGSAACKETFIVLTPLLLVVDDLILERWSLWPRAPRYVMILLVELLWLLLRRHIVGGALMPGQTSIKTLGESYLYLAGTFAGVAADPRRLDAYHPYAPFSAPANLLVASALATITCAAILLARIRQPAARLVACGWVWTLLALVPVTVAGPTFGIIGDRYAYVPCVGLVVACVGICALVAHSGCLGKVVASAIMIGLVGVGAHHCRARAPDWTSDRTLVLASLRTDPGNAYALGELGTQYAVEHRWVQAEDYLGRAIEKGGRNIWRARTALCFVYLNVNRLNEAEEQCRESLEVNGENPRTWLNLATVETRQGRWSLALEYADQALKWRPGYAEAHFVRGLALANLGRRREARAAALRALEIDPTHSGARTLVSWLGTVGP